MTPDDSAKLLARLDRIEATLERIATTTASLNDRVDTVHQEFQRSATQLHRLGLNQEAAKLAGERNQSALADLSAELVGVKKALTER